MTVRLVCPFCRTAVLDDDEAAPGSCSGCDARYAGDGASATEAVAAALVAWRLDDVDPAAFTAELFTREPEDPETRVAITSDERDGFYHWWVFARPD